MTDELNDKVESPCRATGEWAFIGFLQVAKDQEQRVPIGVYSDYALGKAAANAWMQTAGRAIRWEAQKLYEPIDEPEEAAGQQYVEDVTETAFNDGDDIDA